MNELSEIKTMSSREIALLTGKEHKNVLRDCELLNESYEKLGMLKFEPTPYLHPQNGQQYKEYQLSKMQTFDLMTGYSTELRIKVNRRWEELENNKKELSRKELAMMVIESENARELAEQKVLEAENKITELAPKAEFFDKAMTANDGDLTMGETAKILAIGLGRNNLFKLLRDSKILMENNLPYQQYIDSRYFKVKEKTIQRGLRSEIKKITFVTQKGLDWLLKQFNKGNL